MTDSGVMEDIRTDGAIRSDIMGTTWEINTRVGDVDPGLLDSLMGDPRTLLVQVDPYFDGYADDIGVTLARAADTEQICSLTARASATSAEAGSYLVQGDYAFDTPDGPNSMYDLRLDVFMATDGTGTADLFWVQDTRDWDALAGSWEGEVCEVIRMFGVDYCEPCPSQVRPGDFCIAIATTDIPVNVVDTEVTPITPDELSACD